MIPVRLRQSAVFAVTAHLMPAGAGEVRADPAAGAVPPATIILLLDACVAGRPSRTRFGYEELPRAERDRERAEAEVARQRRRAEPRASATPA